MCLTNEPGDSPCDSPRRRFRAAGIDGCPGGWVVAGLRGDQVEIGFYVNLEAAFDAIQLRARVAIDMPIGLLEGEGARACDRLARRRLGPKRGASVFVPPVRAVLSCPDYTSANSRSRALTGKGLSIQSFNITKKIKALDDFLLEQPARRKWVWETHPELVFSALSTGPSLLESKKTPVGRSQRLQLLAGQWPDVECWVAQALSQWPRRLVGVDDILDAMACLVAATAKQVDYCPPKAPRDSRDLRMQLRLPKKSVREG
jgi:predicted RNase H-like nuclease